MKQWRARGAVALQFLERHTQTDLRYVAGGGFWLSIGQAVFSLSAFFIALAYANMLPKDDFGIYKYILSIAGILAAFSLPGINGAVIRSVALGKGGSVLSGTRARMIGGMIGSCATLAIAAYYYLNGNLTLALAACIIAFFLPFFDTFTTLNAYFQGRKDFRSDVFYGNIIRISAATTLIAGVFLTQDILLLVLLYFASYTLFRFGAFWFALLRTPVLGENDPQMVPYGLHLSAMSVLTLVAMQIDKVLLFHFLGAAPLAVYSIATALPDSLRSLIRNSAILAAPKYSRLDEVGARATLPNLWRKMFILSGILLVAIVGYTILSPYFFNIAFAAYPESIPFSQLYALTILGGVAVLPISLIQYQARTRELYILNVVNYALQIILLLLFIPTWGIWGAISARITSFAINEVFTIGLVMYTYRRPRSL